MQQLIKSPQFYINMIQNVSVFLAFTGLLKFYHAVNTDLAWIQPFSKFLCIKGVVFMTFWQGLVIDIIVSVDAGGRWDDMDENSTNPREKAIYLQNVLICLEMLLFSIAHWCVFPNDEWKQGYTRQNLPKPGIGFSDFVSDVSLIVESSKQAKLCRRSQEGSYIHAQRNGHEWKHYLHLHHSSRDLSHNCLSPSSQTQPFVV
jgi:Organic solute transporter Ostalpha